MEKEETSFLDKLESQTEETSPRTKKIFRIFMIVLGVIILYELFTGLRVLFAPLPKVPSPAPLTGGQVSLLTDKSAYNVGDYIPIVIRVSTGGHLAVGTDLYIKYDPTAIDVSNNSFFRGWTFDDFPVVSADKNQGVMKISGIVTPKTGGFSGNGELGRLIVRARKEGTTKLSFDYNLTPSTHSDMIEAKTGSNVLTSAHNLDLKLNKLGSYSVALNKNAKCSDLTYQLCRTNDGNLGTYWCSSINDPLRCNTGCFSDRNTINTGCKVTQTSKIAGLR